MSPGTGNGFQLYSLREQFKTDVLGTLAKIKNWNIREIEGVGTYGLSQDEFKMLLAQNNLKIVSTGADFNQLATNPQTAVEAAKTSGAKYVVCYWIPHKEDVIYN
jgi:sugar phosphate isomerase/epimerase